MRLSHRITDETKAPEVRSFSSKLYPFLINKKTNNPNKKWARDLNGRFSKDM